MYVLLEKVDFHCYVSLLECLCHSHPDDLRRKSFGKTLVGLGLNGSLVFPQPFLCNDLLHHPIETNIKKLGWFNHQLEKTRHLVLNLRFHVGLLGLRSLWLLLVPWTHRAPTLVSSRVFAGKTLRIQSPWSDDWGKNIHLRKNKVFTYLANG